MKKIIIHPYFDAVWCSYFIKGLIDLYGFDNIGFSKEGFPEVDDRSNMGDSSFMYFILNSNGKQIKFSIDAMDTYEYHYPTLEWCDVYAKVNTDPNYKPEKHAHKITPSAPHFPIRPGNYYQIVSMALRTFEFGLKSYKGHFKKHFYRAFKYGRPIESFTPRPSQKNYIFMSSTYWKKNVDTNNSRVNFFRAAKAVPGMVFEGGFFERVDKMPIPYPDLIYKKPSKGDYLDKVYKSTVVFTNPSVYGAHSFRISEYLVMGKAILAPPLLRLTTYPLVHGEHIHFVEAEYEALKEAIEKINSDDAYREKLEKGARSYYENYGRPMKMMEKVIAFGESQVTAGK